jgi:glutamate-1-semialdehyde 2,1-aminomutase
LDKGQQQYEFAREYLVGGVSSSVRLCRAYGNRPFYVAHGEGAKVVDVDGREYIDLCTSHGASLLGHKHPKIVAALQQAAEMGIICSYETEYQSALAEKIVELVPCAELVRFSGSGTETTMHTIRLAREYTGRDKILKFTGHFHGYHDYVLFEPEVPVSASVQAESRLIAQSGGIPADMDRYVIIAPDNDGDALDAAIRKHKDELAAVILEPIHYNAGCIIPKREYIQQLRDLTLEHGIVLIFDEVLSGFRMAPGGAQEYLGVTPDLCTLGKAVGGGLPLSAICGKREIMEHVKPLGNAQHSGTYNGTLVCILAGLAALEEYSTPGIYDRIHATGQHLYDGIAEIITRLGVKARVQGLGARFGIYFGVDEEVKSYRQSLANDDEMATCFIEAAWKNGVYFHDYGGRGAHHHGFSAAHTVADIDRALDGIEAAFQAVIGH